MGDRSEIRTYIWEQYLPVEYSTYKYPAYLALNNAVYGVQDIAETIPQEDIYGIYERFEQIHPGLVIPESMSKDELRNLHFKHTVNGIKEIVRLKDATTLLVDLLVLIEKNKDMKADELLPQISMLCNDYGLLCWQEEKVESSDKEHPMEYEGFYYVSADGKHIPVQLDPDDQNKQNSIRFCMTDSQIEYALMRFRILYLAWREIFWGVDEKPKKELNSLLERYGRNWMLHDAESYSTKDYEIVIENISKEINITYLLSFEKGTPTSIPRYHNAFEAATGIMLRIISTGMAAKDGKTEDLCKKCNKVFVKENGKNKFCKAHSRNSERAKDYRDRKKKAKTTKLVAMTNNETDLHQ